MAADRHSRSSKDTVRMRDVAAAARVDPSVVSRVLSGDETLSIRPETRSRVLAAVRDLNYRPNTAAQTLKTSRSMALGMVIPDIANTVYASIAVGAEKRASAAGYLMLVATGSVARRLHILDGRVEGLLYAIAASDAVPVDTLTASTPSVLVNRREPNGGPSVVVDDEQGAAVATRYLLALGHTRIGHIAGPHNVDTARRRRNGFDETLRAAGLPVRPQWVAEASFDELGGWTAAARLLRATPRPSALFVANARAAIGAIAAVHQAGLRVPQDVSVIGFHDVPVAAFLNPPLSTVRMPLEELGGCAVETLLRMISGEPVADVVLTTPPVLVERGSCAAPSTPT
jgi:LacI family transcriptional regulator